MNENGAASSRNLSFYYVISSVAAGTHTFCLSMLSSGGLANTLCGPASAIAHCKTQALFGAIELH